MKYLYYDKCNKVYSAAELNAVSRVNNDKTYAT